VGCTRSRATEDAPRPGEAPATKKPQTPPQPHRGADQKKVGGQRVPHALAAGAIEPPKRVYWRLAAPPVGCASVTEVPG
jgi:hypothetical protein